MKRVVAFGEVMLRLSPPGPLRFAQTDTLEMTFGGAEVNVAVALAQLGWPAAFVTRLPENEIARACLSRIRAAGVDVGGVLRGGERIGAYYVERGGGARSASVTYDRKGSAIATLDPDSLDWNTLLAGAGALHISGITPALSAEAARAARDGMEAARRLGVAVSMDVNYRAKLWSEADAGRALAPYLDLLDWCVCNETHARRLFGIDADTDAGIADAFAARHPNLKAVAVTRRRTRDSLHDHWGATLRTPDGVWASPTHEIAMVERVGGGDSFAAGLLYGLLSGWAPRDAVEFGAAALALKHTIVGDFASFTRAEVDAFRASGGSGAVQR